MIKSILSLSVLFTISLCLFVSCGDDTDPMEMFTDNFDREAMLTEWADLIIIPSFERYVGSLEELNDNTEAFLTESTVENLNVLRLSYIEAYMAWQRVEMFNIGKAEEIGLMNFTNVYPTDAESIDENLSTGDYNLSLPSANDEQGFPALDYLLYGIASDEQSIIAVLTEVTASQFLTEIVDKLSNQTGIVLDDWTITFRSSFISNSGSSATASVDKMVNDFIFYYERQLRAGKIGIPAGVFSGSPIATSVEAPYSEIYSKKLFIEGFNAVQDFFIGNSSNNQTAISIKAYLDFISEQNQSADIAMMITDQWGIAADTFEALSDDFGNQIIEDNSKMLNTYDELQLAVVLLKVNMLQALNIQVDFIDADGD